MNSFRTTSTIPSFVVYTKLTNVLSSAKLNATGLRWIGELADFNFTIRYHPGKTNTDLILYPECRGLWINTWHRALRRLVKTNYTRSYSQQRSKTEEESTGFLLSHTIQTYWVKVNPSPQRKMNQGSMWPTFDKLNSTTASLVKCALSPRASESADTKLLLHEWPKLAMGMGRWTLQ